MSRTRAPRWEVTQENGGWNEGQSPRNAGPREMLAAGRQAGYGQTMLGTVDLPESKASPGFSALVIFEAVPLCSAKYSAPKRRYTKTEKLPAQYRTVLVNLKSLN